MSADATSEARFWSERAIFWSEAHADLVEHWRATARRQDEAERIAAASLTAGLAECERLRACIVDLSLRLAEERGS